MTKNINFPLQNLDTIIWVDGEFIKSRDAQVHLLTHSMQYGGGVFEGLRSYNGKIFKLEEHTQRLFNSARLMRLNINFSMDEVNEIHHKLVKLNKLSNAYFRPFVWRSTDSIRIVPDNPVDHIMISGWEVGGRIYKKLNLKISDWIKMGKNMFPSGCKASAQYGLLSVAAMDAREEGCDDAILLDEKGFIAECTSSNIFFIQGSKIITPKSNYCLDGITRQTIIQIAKKLEMECFELDISPLELSSCDSAFVSGTASGIVEVSRITHQNEVIEFSSNENFAILREEYQKLTGKHYA